jgi:hypothetical protein
MTEENIAKINEVIAEYFKTATKEAWVPAKKLMPSLIKAGIFIKDEKNGMPLRRVFRKLDAANSLDKIPSVHAERNGENIYWYLVREGAAYVAKNPNDTGVPKEQQRRVARANSDAYYVLDLCDQLLAQHASRRHKFGFILGDLHKDGKTRTVLPVAAYYEQANLVIELLENRELAALENDKPGSKTISGVDRSEQRKIYALRKREALLSNKISLLEIDFTAFEYDAENKLMRNKEQDTEVLKKLLKDFI